MWRCGAFQLDTRVPLVMGILNVTPDSFSDGGAHSTQEAAVAHAHLLLAQGAHIIDVGGESTRPGSDAVDVQEELARVLPVVRVLAQEGRVVSVDTRHAEVARACVEAGAVIVNDVTGFGDPAMVALARSCEVGLVVMHMQGEPRTMQAAPVYRDVVAEVGDFLLTRAIELEACGVARERICLDPGPGFGKSFEHNLALLRATGELAALRVLESDEPYPLMAAWSRKGFVGELTGVAVAAERVAGSVAVAVFAAAQGARVLRVHDVAPTVAALKVLRAVGAGAVVGAAAGAVVGDVGCEDVGR